jgi:pyruvate/2-oxoglutarate dehydrogenase complex dihydrolipoamide dehydrogenase (E3) component
MEVKKLLWPTDFSGNAEKALGYVTSLMEKYQTEVHHLKAVLSERVRVRCTIAIFSTAIGETAFGAAGVNENMANERGFDFVTGSFEGIDKHPGALPGTHKQFVKLIVSRESGILIGGEVIGGASTGELINLIGFAIQNRMTVVSILTAQIGTHPLLTAPPTAYPLIKAAEKAAMKRRSAG